jgi:hypothetical protein
LPNCAVCRGAASAEDELSVTIGDFGAADVTIVNYVPGQTIQITVTDFDDVQFTAIATMDDGTVVEFYGVQPTAARRLIESGNTVEAEIVRKTVENGILHLSCSSPELPLRTIIEVNQELAFIIVGFSNSGQPYGFLPSGEIVLLHTKEGAIGNEGRGYFWGETVSNGQAILNCLRWRKDQIVDAELLYFPINEPGVVVGRLSNNQIILFHYETEEEKILYQLALTFRARINGFQWQDDGDLYLLGELGE